MQQQLPRHEIVLLGVGHTNAHVLRMWKMEAIPNARLTCISNFGVASYSGMMPGVLAGQYPPERMEIDLVRLCAAAGARLIVDQVTEVDPDAQRVHFAERPGLHYDQLSIGIGSRPSCEGVEIETDAILSIKPMQTFLSRLDLRLKTLLDQQLDRPLRIAVVGAGIGGIETCFCLPGHFRELADKDRWQIVLIDSSDAVANGTSARTSAAIHQELRERGVEVHLGQRATAVTRNHVRLQDGSRVAADVVVWATGAVAPPLLGRCGLPTDKRGFLLTTSTLQSVASPHVYAVGDSGTLRDDATPKAGVYAVRQGPILWQNLKRNVAGRPLRRYHPQQGFLRLINLGNGAAIGEWRGVTLRGSLVWRLKDWIDRRFMDKYQDYEPMPMVLPVLTDDPPVMRCTGCGGKVGGSVLSASLAQLQIPPSVHVILGLEQPDDAAVLQWDPSGQIVATTDFFAAPLDDPYLVGRIAVLNAASDLFAMGTQPKVALAMVTLPQGPAAAQMRTLTEVLVGSLLELRRMGATLAGGHTIEGPQLTVGFTFLGQHTERGLMTKADLQPGDRLVLTKPIGSGVLLAAHMQARCRAAWFAELLHWMLISNQQPVVRCGVGRVAAMTDVTGFGLASHLLEMLRASRLSAQLQLSDLPVLHGAESLVQEGIESTLAPANRHAEHEIEVRPEVVHDSKYPLLFDPQTCGGLLLGVTPRECDAVIAQIEADGESMAQVIGTVTEVGPYGPRLHVV